MVVWWVLSALFLVSQNSFADVLVTKWEVLSSSSCRVCLESTSSVEAPNTRLYLYETIPPYSAAKCTFLRTPVDLIRTSCILHGVLVFSCLLLALRVHWKTKKKCTKATIIAACWHPHAALCLFPVVCVCVCVCSSETIKWLFRRDQQ